MNDVVKLAVDAYYGKIDGNYSAGEAMDTLRSALIEANNGSTKLDLRAIRDHKCDAMFAIIEEIIEETVITGIETHPLFMQMVEYRDLARGDMNEFTIEDNNLFVVSDMADGTQAIRRQRLVDGESITIPTQLRGVKVYEELTRLLAGRIDFNKFIDIVSKSFKAKVFNDIQIAWNTALDAIVAPYRETGSYVESKMLDLIEHVEAATGKNAFLTGTMTALSKVKAASTDSSELVKDQLYNFGIAGKFYGTPMIRSKQWHKPGTDLFALDNNVVDVLALGERPIKFVTEGKPLLIMGNPINNNDLTQEFLIVNNYGVGFLTGEKRGRYVIA